MMCGRATVTGRINQEIFPLQFIHFSVIMTRMYSILLQESEWTCESTLLCDKKICRYGGKNIDVHKGDL